LNDWQFLARILPVVVVLVILFAKRRRARKTARKVRVGGESAPDPERQYEPIEPS